MDMQFIDDAVIVLSAQDAVMREVLRSIEPISPPSKDLCFENTARIVINQQLSGKAANTIFSRILNVVEEFTPSSIIETPTDKLRNCGLSRAKIQYIKALAEKCQHDQSYLTSFISMTDEAAFARIRENKGFGDWSAYIFLLFHLKRPNIFPEGDATLNSVISELYGVSKSNTDDICRMSDKWSPYKSIACLALWRWADSGKPAINTHV
ncbi:DNA-3-methyladenine glycosylase family protein [Varunaivibrio sulfuroxidans]|uniref:DNA-3-methyladenine glycosylase II n=1 Tax=Varunaivibrio sulfuroxidans TaxID=1773489 RepID=A0A4R3J822_9PROT|nr:DNA-3-methyladenine glycosylase [Varunaivibrio sulfuroxidans]TCS61602.1 DNA-3-methyladenine glycosylase II [Varunaivibrio sulfuroxidans]WES29523.1 DNA-3-methyladenine glycosylase [Varunaivibrio sulfuroxidans]